jgi:hypothetical protein
MPTSTEMVALVRSAYLSSSNLVPIRRLWNPVFHGCLKRQYADDEWRLHSCASALVSFRYVGLSQDKLFCLISDAHFSAEVMVIVDMAGV